MSKMFCFYSVLVVLFYLAGMGNTEGIQDKFGLAFTSENVRNQDSRGIWLSPQHTYDLPVEAVIYQFCGYVVEVYTVWFQLWRPLEDQQNTYSLVGQVRLKPQYISQFYNVPVPRNTPLIARKGDLLGIYNEGDGCALAYEFQESSKAGSRYSATEQGATLVTNQNITFDPMIQPFQFSVEAHYDTDISKYLGPFDPISTTEVNETQGQTEEIPVTSGTLNYTGNSLAGRNQIMEENAKAMYLFPGIQFTTGVVVEFHAFFRKKQQVVFQIWRMYGKNSYVLVGSYAHMPENVPAYEKVSLSFGSYIFVHNRDFLGVAVLSDVGPITYRMTDFQYDKGPFLASIVNNRLPQISEIVTFGQTHYPYDFAIGAIYDTDIDTEKYGTAAPIIPRYPSSPTEPRQSGSPTPSSPFTPFSIQVPSGHSLIGDRNLHIASNVLSNGAQRSFILPEMIFPSAGLVVSFHTYVVQPGDLSFQIWRRYDDTQFELIGQKDITLGVTTVDDFEPRLLQITLEADEQIQVLKDDCMGFANKQESSVIGYQFQSTSLYSSATGTRASVGDVIAFDPLPLPYRFSLAATFQKDDLTTQLNDLKSTSTDDNISNPSAEKQVETNDSFTWVMDAKIVFGLLVWLILLTVLFFMLLVCFLCALSGKKNQVEENKRTSFLYDYQSRNGVTRTPSTYLTHNPSKEGDVMNYFNPKTGSRAGPVMRNDSMKEQLIESDDTEDKYMDPRNINNNNKRPDSMYSDNSNDTVTVITHHGDMHTHM